MKSCILTGIVLSGLISIVYHSEPLVFQRETVALLYAENTEKAEKDEKRSVAADDNEEESVAKSGSDAEAETPKAAAVRKRIVVDLASQRLLAYENERIVYNFHISSGRPGKRTPKGSFRILNKKRLHISSRYPRPDGGARMPWALHYKGHYFIHGYHEVPLRPASSGCVRIAVSSAEKLFAWAPVGTPVRVQ